MKRFVETLLAVVLVLAFAVLLLCVCNLAQGGDRPEAHIYQAFRSNECFVCGSTESVEWAHSFPYALSTNGLEHFRTDRTNGVSLCHDHHFWVGHYGNWKEWNTELIPICNALRNARREMK